MGIIVTSLEYLGRLVVRRVTYEELYLNIKDQESAVLYLLFRRILKASLEKLYGAIVVFLVEPAKHFNRATLGMIDHFRKITTTPFSSNQRFRTHIWPYS